MKKEIMANVLMIIAIVLVMAAGPAIWVLYSLGAGIPFMALSAMTMISVAAACFDRASYMTTENEEEETEKEERL